MHSVAAALLGLMFASASRPPTPYVDKGACPFEGCAYREWVATRDIRLLDRPNGKRVVGTVRAREHVAGVTGEVDSVPMRVHATENILNPAKRDQILIPKGAVFWLLHPLGEGYWRCWYQGRLVDLENVQQGAAYPETIWWVKIKTASGLVGWAISDNNFDGQDSLG